VSAAVGVDVGATKLAGARVDAATGEILARLRRPTLPQRGGDAVLADVHALADELGGRAGLAVCELVGTDGRVRSAETVDWRDADLGAFAAVESDVRAAAVAEARFGAGREQPDFLYVSVGSGISHCLVADGRPRAGVHGSAIGTGAPLVEATAQDALADPAAEAVVAEGAERLGLVLAVLVNALDPGAVVVGGGLGLHEGYRARVERALRAAVYDDAVRGLPVVPAALGADAPVIGAALAAAAAR
jgi:predicted NBD/HSP70 family sugar kinase